MSAFRLSTLPRLLRVKQWTKNGFVLTPLLFSASFMRIDAIVDSLYAVLAFSLVASAVYIANDLIDLKADRAHPRKRHRPLASGALSLPVGGIIAALCLAGGFFIGLRLNASVLIVLGVYVALQGFYSFGLKHVAIVDTMLIAVGFILRVYVGAFAISVPVSSWFLLTAFFLSLFLALAKRKIELDAHHSGEQRPVLRVYSPELLSQLIPLTLGLTVVSYSLYTVDPSTVARIGTDRLIFTVPIVLYGMFRYLLLANRPNGSEDPSETFVTDPGMIIAVALWVVITGAVLFTGELL